MKLPLKASLVWAWLLLLALLPANNLLWPLLLLASLLLPFPTWTLLLLFPLKLLPLLLDPLLDSLGYWWLTWAPLQPLWAALQRFPLLPLMGYDHSLVAGSLLIAPLLWPLSLALLLTGRALHTRIREWSFPYAPANLAPQAYPCKRLPSRTKRPFSQLQMKQLLRHLPLEQRTQLRALFEEEGSHFRVRSPLNHKQGKTLRRLYWRSRYCYWQRRRIFILLGLFLAGGLVLSWAKDAWLQARISRQLERWHGAQVDLAGFSLRLLKGRIAFDSLQVTDPNNPSYNLVQLGPSQLDIKPGELLRGRLVVEVMESLNSAFNSPRPKEGRVSRLASPSAQLPPPSPWQFNLPQIDPDALLIQQLDQLASSKLLQHLQQYYQQRLLTWEPLGQQRQSELMALQQALDQAFRQQPHDWLNSDALRQRLEQLEMLRIRCHNLISQSQEDISALSADLADLENSWETVQLQINRDLATLAQRLAAQALLGSLQPLVEQIATQQIQQLLRRYPQWQQLSRLRSLQPAAIAYGATKTKSWLARRGRRVLFSSPGQLPRLYLQRLTFSRGQAQSNDFLLLELQHLSSRPQLVADPITANWRSRRPEGSSTAGKLVLDLHSPDHPSTLNFSWAQQPLVLGPTFFGTEAAISNYRASAQYLLQASWQHSLINATLEADILSEEVASGTPLLAQLLRAMLLEKKLQLALSLGASEDQPLHLVSAHSNIDQLALPTWEKLKSDLLQQAGSRLDQLLSQRLQQLWSRELRDPVAAQLRQLLPSLTDNSDSLGQKLIDLNAETSRLQQLGAEMQRAAEAKITAEKRRLTETAATGAERLRQKAAAEVARQKNKLLQPLFPPS